MTKHMKFGCTALALAMSIGLVSPVLAETVLKVSVVRVFGTNGCLN